VSAPEKLLALFLFLQNTLIAFWMFSFKTSLLKLCSFGTVTLCSHVTLMILHLFPTISTCSHGFCSRNERFHAFNNSSVAFHHCNVLLFNNRTELDSKLKTESNCNSWSLHSTGSINRNKRMQNAEIRFIWSFDSRNCHKPEDGSFFCRQKFNKTV